MIVSITCWIIRLCLFSLAMLQWTFWSRNVYVAKPVSAIICFWKGFIIYRGDGTQSLAVAFLITIRRLLSSSLFFLAPLCVPTQLQGLFVLGDLEQLHGGLLEGKTIHPSDHGPHELGMLGKALLAAAVPRLVHVLGYRVAMATALHWLSPLKGPHCIEHFMDF